MRILIVCSGNIENFNFEKHRAYIYDQMVALQKNFSHIAFDTFFIKGKGVFGYLNNIKNLRKKLRQNEYDIIHSHYALSSFIANMQRRVPVITTFHGSDINLYYLNIVSSLVNMLSAHSIFVSKKLLNKILAKKRGNRMHVIPCGIDLEKFYQMEKTVARNYFGFDDKKKYILFSSFFAAKVKNYPLAAKAVELIKDKSLVLLEFRDYSREEVNILLNAVDVALMTSFTEGSPQIIKEAMAVGCPIVSTDVGDVREIIADIQGCFISSYDAYDIADKLNKALSYGKSIGSREKIQHFDNKFITDYIYKVYLKTMHL